MIINSPRVCIFEGCDGVGKTTLVEKVKELLTSKYQTPNTKIVTPCKATKFGEEIYKLHHRYENLYIHGMARSLMNVASRVQTYHEIENDPFLVLLLDRSFLTSMAYSYAYPQYERTKEIEVRSLFNLELPLIPQKLQPSHVFFLTNPPHEKTSEEWENQNKVQEGYNYVMNVDYCRSWLKQRSTYAIQNRKNRLEETAELVIDIIINQ